MGLKYGIAEIIFGADHISSGTKIGGVPNRLCKLIAISKGEVHEPIKPPNFTNYEELGSILKESLSLYKDFKNEVLKIKP